MTTTPNLPLDTGYGTVRWTVIGIAEDDVDADTDPQSEAVTGTVTFTPQFLYMKFIGDAADPEKKTILPRPETYNLVNGRLQDRQGNTDVRLVANNNPATSPQLWNYRADFLLDDGYSFGTFYFDLGAGEVKDLTDEVPQQDPDTGILYVQGPPGPGFTWRGAWASGQSYDVNDVVSNGGSVFVVTAPVPLSSGAGPTVAAPGAEYALWSEKGDTGPAGASGVSVVEAADGTLTLTGSGVVDNGDGTFSLSA